MQHGVVLITDEVLSSPKKGRARSLCLRAKAGVLPCGENTGPAASEDSFHWLSSEHLVIHDTPLRDPGMGQWKGVSRFATEAEFTRGQGKQATASGRHAPPNLCLARQRRCVIFPKTKTK